MENQIEKEAPAGDSFPGTIRVKGESVKDFYNKLTGDFAATQRPMTKEEREHRWLIDQENRWLDSFAD